MLRNTFYKLKTIMRAGATSTNLTDLGLDQKPKTVILWLISALQFYNALKWVVNYVHYRQIVAIKFSTSKKLRLGLTYTLLWRSFYLSEPGIMLSPSNYKLANLYTSSAIIWTNYLLHNQKIFEIDVQHLLHFHHEHLYAKILITWIQNQNIRMIYDPLLMA